MNDKYYVREDKRIVALKAGPWGDVGTVGGFIYDNAKLSRYGNCWLYDNSSIHDTCTVEGDATMHESARADGKALIADYSSMYYQTYAGYKSCLIGSAKLYGKAQIKAHAFVGGSAILTGKAVATDYSFITNNAVVQGTTTINSDSSIGKNAFIQSNKDYLVIPVAKDRNLYLTCYRTISGVNTITNGCVYASTQGITDSILAAICPAITDFEKVKEAIKHWESNLTN